MLYRKPSFLGLLYNTWSLYVRKLYGKNFTGFDANTLNPQNKITVLHVRCFALQDIFVFQKLTFWKSPKRGAWLSFYAPSFTCFEFCERRHKDRLQHYSGEIFMFLETFFAGMCRVAERINLYWTHCRTYKDRGWMDSFCLHSTWNWRTSWHYCNFNYFSVTFRIAGLPTWRATDCDLVKLW